MTGSLKYATAEPFGIAESIGLPQLIAAGFRRNGCWQSEDGIGIALDFDSDRAPGVYAYVVDGTVMYVGSAQRGLRNRFRRYVLSHTMRTSQRVRGEIIALLAAGKIVEVFTLVPPAHYWNGLPLDLIAGIEEGLIRALRPAWNKRSNTG